MNSGVLELVRYGIVGVINTAVGLAVIYLFMALGAGDVTANAMGYGVGFCISYVMNGKWTFRHSHLNFARFFRFVVVVLAAYALNLCVLLSLRGRVQWGSHWGQLAGVVVYALAMYAGMKFVAFKKA